jgi:anti-sigma factor RsiW
MSCSNYDWKGYVLGELDAVNRREAEAHAAHCSLCREELASTRLTLDALSTLREEEIPRRIAFVSDKVFEPRPWQRWWQAFLRPSFAGAMAIALAILAHAWVSFNFNARPDAAIQAQIDNRINAAVTRAVAEADQRQVQELKQLFPDYDILSKQNMLMYAKNARMVRN